MTKDAAQQRNWTFYEAVITMTLKKPVVDITYNPLYDKNNYNAQISGPKTQSYKDKSGIPCVGIGGYV
ncbi:MAG: hypothetical protein SWH61_01375 [Thermodesulfobacteriota bacterium]|nr:hypothetical protein [Thermodesulfobacteriota bacterium]